MNRLGDATSPYLLQHADNPVDWWPWGAEAFAEAARRDVTWLRELAAAHDTAGRPWRLRDLAATAAARVEDRRAPVRIAVVAGDLDELATLLARAAIGEHDPAHGLHQPAEDVEAGELALLFPGQGSQRTGMLAELFVAFPGGEDPVPPPRIPPDGIDEARLLLLEDGHCLKDHVLAACNRPELRAEAQMLGTSLHTLVQMVDNGLGVTLLPEMALEAGILNGTKVTVRPLAAAHPARRIALVWRKSSPREKEFSLLAEELSKAAAD